MDLPIYFRTPRNVSHSLQFNSLDEDKSVFKCIIFVWIIVGKAHMFDQVS